VVGRVEERMSEHPQRLERLRALMVEHGMQAVLLGTGANLAYFSGYPCPPRSVPRPFFVLLPLKGEPVFFTHMGHAAEARRFSWISDIRSYEPLARVPVESIKEALAEKELLGATIGMELGKEQAFDFSYLEFLRLRSTLADANFEDAAPLLWALRMVKSPWEISCIRQACKITSEAYGAAFAFARRGMSERHVYLSMQDYLTRNSDGTVFLAITSGSGNYDLVTKPAEEPPLVAGDLVWMDAGCTVSGYWSDFSRAGTVGKATDEQRYAQDAVHQITWEAISQMRPGAKASSIWQFCSRALQALPFHVSSSITQLAARVGHGVGLAMTEPPHLGVNEEAVLKEGMVIAIEPGIATRYGTFHVEENVLITKDGCEVLSLAPRILQQIRL
jgi:Xaa-Pro dipeptidase